MTTPKTDGPGDVDHRAREDAVERIRVLNERLIKTAKAAGARALDAYEKALKSLVDFEEKVAGASQLDWISALTHTHATLIRDMSEAYVKAARKVVT